MVEGGRSSSLEIVFGLRTTAEAEVAEGARRMKTGVEGRTKVDRVGLGTDASTVHWELCREHAIMSQLSSRSLARFSEY